jgi:hypothetical protein
LLNSHIHLFENTPHIRKIQRGKFPRLTKKEAKARLKEIKRLLLAI